MRTHDEGRTGFTRASLDLGQKVLTVEWGDGHISAYPLGYLRKHCPCASCRHERDEAGAGGGLMVLSGAALRASDALQDIVPVGRYGMQPMWADGHSTGIFTFDYLRDLCPCPPCREGAV